MIEDRFDRQSFLGHCSQNIIENCRVGIVGLGGGGSHIIQQLAHVGFRDYVLFDTDYVANSNLNRLVGATVNDAKKGMLKTEVAQRIIVGLQPNATIKALNFKWQDNPLMLRTCDIVFGCVDSFIGRQELEICLRRFLIPYIDIGMDVITVGNEAPRISGQIILSCPGYPCMQCLDILSPKTITKEAQHYGAAGNHPQVVWSNGILASTALGVAMDLITGWTKEPLSNFYLVHDGNKLTVSRSHRLDFINNGACPHFPLTDVGSPIFQLMGYRNLRNREKIT